METKSQFSNVDMWEIFVPVFTNDGRKIPLVIHRNWDSKVVALTGGLTLFTTVDGKWGDRKERMIPVKIAATKEQMETIARMTRDHYDQESVLFYKVGTDVSFINDDFPTSRVLHLMPDERIMLERIMHEMRHVHDCGDKRFSTEEVEMVEDFIRRTR